jgi:cupin 2 domain-containing protein
MIKLNNIFEDIPKKITGEIVKRLLSSKKFMIERVVSAASNLPSHVYNQKEGEFVMLIDGYAELEFQKQIVKMRKGDYINIPPHSKHRILKTDKNTQWLCIFYKTK